MVYQSEDLMNSMTITFSISGSSEVNGIIHENEKVFSLAACDQTGGDCHVLAEENVDHLIEGETASNVTMRDLDLMVRYDFSKVFFPRVSFYESYIFFVRRN